MGFDINKLKQIKNQNIRNSQTFGSIVRNAFGITNSKVLSFINSEEFENNLQEILEEKLTNMSIYDNDNKARFEYSIQYSLNNCIDHADINVRVGIMSSSKPIVNISVNDLKLPTQSDYEKVVKYFDDNVPELTHEINARLDEKFTELKVQSLMCKETELSRNRDVVTYVAWNGLILI